MSCSTTYIITHRGVLWRLFIVDFIVTYLDSLAVIQHEVSSAFHQ